MARTCYTQDTPQLEVKEGVDQETVDAVKSLSGQVQARLEHRLSRWITRRRDLSEDIVRLISEKERRT